MKIKVVIIVVLFSSITVAGAEPMGNLYGSANGWFNGQEATVKNVKLRIGEPADIKVTVTSNISGHVFVKLTNPLVTEPYDVIKGPSKIGESIDNYDITAGWSKTYTWTIIPNGAWKNGNAPINAFIQINKDWNDDKTIEFTIANPYILDEQYTGAATMPVQPSDTAPGSTTPKATPFLSAVLVIAILLVAWRRH